MDDQEAAEFVRGFDVWRSQINAAAKRPGAISGTNTAEITDQASKTSTRGLGNVSVITPLRQPVLMWSRLVGRNSLKEMDRLLTSPEGVSMLVTLGKKPATSPAVQNAINTFLATGGALETAPDTPPNPAGIMQ